MSFSYISKISLYLSFLFIFSCHDKILFLDKGDTALIKIDNHIFEETEKIDLTFFEVYENDVIDFYSTQSSAYNFLNKELNKIKINNYENKYNFNSSINILYHHKNIYSINSKGELLTFDINTGKLIDRFLIGSENLIKDPVSFSLYKNDFIVAFKTGEVFRINKTGEIIWQFENKDILNTPIKIFNDHLIVLYSDKIVFLTTESGNIVFEKTYKSNNIIQSSGGKIDNYFSIFFFLLSNSEFNALDTFLFEEYDFDYDKIELDTSLNNLKDEIHTYKNYLVYLDDGINFHTYNINKNRFILKDYRINKSTSVTLFNNALISKDDNFLYFYNIKNGNLFAKINIKNILNKRSRIIKALINHNKLHLFTDNGDVIIFDKNLNIEENLNLKIKKINKVYSYQNKIFISTQKGITYIF